MKPREILLSLIALALSSVFASCDDDPSPILPKPDGDALSAWFNDGAEKRTQRFTIDASTGGNITGENGTILKFSSNAFSSQADELVTGSVDIELIEIYDRATMLLTNKPTTGMKSDGSTSTLVSGGEFYINATQGGTPLKLKTGFTIVAPTDNTGDASQDMKLFNGQIECQGNDCTLIWTEEADRGIDIGEIQAAGGFKTAYFVFQTKFGWTNIDRWYNDPRQKTTVFVDVPEGFDNTNCSIYLAYDGEPAALASLDRYDKDKALFTEHYGMIPIGLKVHFILISIIEGDVHYAVQSTTIVENHTEVIDEVNSITEEQLVEIIRGLP